MRPTTLTTAAAVLALFLTGCAGPPLIDIDRPGLTARAESGHRPTSLPEARAMLLELRGAYRGAMAQQLNVTPRWQGLQRAPRTGTRSLAHP